MKVSLIQTGGVLNLRLGCVVDTAQLEPGAAHIIEEAVASGGLFKNQRRRSRAHDAAEYLIEVETSSGHRSVHFTDTEQTPSAAAVVRVLRPMIKPFPRRGG